MTYAGIHTVELDQPIDVQEGDRYAVVVTIKKSGQQCYLLVDETYSTLAGISYTASIVAGRSYYSLNGTTWIDTSTGQGDTDKCTMRIKAFTDDEFDDESAEITEDMIAKLPDMEYTGEKLTPDPVIVCGSKRLTQNTDYTVTYGSNTTVGNKSGVLTIKGAGNYTTKSSIIMNFNIVKKQITDSDITIEGLDDITYTGKKLTPVVFYHGSNQLTNANITLTYKNNLNAGTATVTAKGTGNYAGTITKTFQITQRKIYDEGLTYGTVKDYSYSGDFITPDVTIRNSYNGNVLLSAKTEMGITYKNNVMPGTAQITIAGKGNYTGTKILTFQIGNIDISELAMSEIPSQTYNGNLVRPEIKLKYGTKELRESIDFTTTYQNNLNAGTATVKISGKEGTVYEGSERTETFEILQANLSTCTLLNFGDVAYATGTSTYTQNETKGSSSAMKVRLPNGAVLENGTDYSVTYQNNKSAGAGTITATMTITAQGGNITGKIVKTFKIVPNGKILLNDYTNNNLVVSGFSSTREYIFDTTDKRKNATHTIKPALTVTYKGKALTEGVDYKITYQKCEEVGTATATITAITGSSYLGTRVETYYIIGKPIYTALGTLDNDFAVAGIKDCVYTGEAQKQSLTITEQTIKDHGQGGRYALVEGEDYTLSYRYNVNVGSAECTVTGTGNYSGSHTYQYEILQANMENLSAPVIKAQTYTGETIDPEVYIKCGSNYLLEGTDYELQYGENTDVGTGYITFQALPDSQNFTGSRVITFPITAKTLNSLNIGSDIATISAQIYDGNKKEPEVTVSCSGIVVPDTEYFVIYGANTKIGKGKITLRAKKVTEGGSGNFKGSKSITFDIVGKPIDIDTEYTGGDITYTGKACKPALKTVTLSNNTILYNKQDYQVKYQKAVNVGTGKMILIGKGVYKGSQAEITYNIVPLQVNSSNLTISNIREQKLGTQTAVWPTASVRVNNRKCKARQDYTMTYLYNTKAGTAVIRFYFIGNYKGTAQTSFKIVQ